MSWLQAIDKILALAPVRWLLLVATVVLSVSVAVQTIRFMAAENQRDAEASRNATLGAAINAQNNAIKKAGDDMEKLQKRLDMALSEAKKRQQELEKRKRELINMPLTGDCENMVQQVVQELKRR